MRWCGLVVLECRKAVNTRSAHVTFLAMVLASVASVAISSPFTADLDEFIGGAILPLVAFLPVVAVVASTSEWGTGAIATTFILVPRRIRVLSARLVATIIVVDAAALAAASAAGLAFCVLRPHDLTSVDWTRTASAVASVVAVALAASLSGAALGALVLNTSAAIVLALLLPLTFDVSMAVAAPEIGRWISALAFSAWLSNPTGDLGFTSDGAPGLAAAGSSFMIWVVAPLLVGWWRQVRRDVT